MLVKNNNSFKNVEVSRGWGHREKARKNISEYQWLTLGQIVILFSFILSVFAQKK